MPGCAMNGWTNEARSLVFLVLGVGFHWLLCDRKVVVSECYLLMVWACGPKHWAEGMREAFASSIFACEGFSRWFLTDVASLARLGSPGVGGNAEGWTTDLNRSQAFWSSNPVFCYLYVWLPISLWTSSFKIWKMNFGKWDKFSDFLTFHYQGPVYENFLLYSHVLKLPGLIMRKIIIIYLESAI